MFSNADLDDAVRDGAISADSAAALRAYVDRINAAPAADEEQFRLLTSFNDIFVAIAIMLVLVPLGLNIGALAVAGAAWGLAEYFTRVRRMALPSILLLLAFVVSVGLFTGQMLLGRHLPTDVPGDVVTLMRLAGAGLVTAGAAWLHWWRFKVPITVAAGMAALVGMLLAMVLAVVPRASGMLEWMLLAAGIGVFFVAMRWDMSDRLRQTRRSDVAFWLHLLAAPMIVHPVFLHLGLVGGHASQAAALAGLLVYFALAGVALLTDRRAIMVSALVYVLAAISVLFERSGSISDNLAVTAIAIGSVLLMLSALWQRLRRWLVRMLPLSWQTCLPAVH